jgi:hypothetical protein
VREVSETVTVCTFVYRNLSMPTLGSLFGLRSDRIPFLVMFQHGDALISRARSIAATNWLLHMKGDVLVMSDDDFRFTTAGVEALVDLCREKRGIVAGVTPLKSGEYTAIVPLNNLDLVLEPWRDSSYPPIQIKYAGGLIAYHRDVFEAMNKDLPLLHQNSSIEPFYPFFMPMIVGDEYLSEDYACHQRAQNRGFEIWVEPKCQVGHLASHLVVTTANMDRIKELYS